MYKLNANDNGDVEYIAPAGSSFVRSSMPEGRAVGIIESASKVEKSDKFADFEICVNDGEFYFNGKITASKAKAEPKADEPEVEEKPVKKTASKKK